MPLSEIFKRLGLPKHSGAVYRVLSLNKDSLLISAIANQSKLPRMTIYRCIEALIKMKFVTVSTIGKRTYYSASSPRVIEEAMRVQEKQTSSAVQKHLKVFEKDVPKTVRFLQGPAGIKAAFDDVITHSKKGHTFFRYTSEQDLSKVNQYLSRDYRIRRDKKKLERLVISNAVSGSQKRARLERFIKFIPTEVEQFQQNIIQLVYGNRMSIIDLNTEEVTIIENKQLAEFQKVLFRLLYKRLY